TSQVPTAPAARCESSAETGRTGNRVAAQYRPLGRPFAPAARRIRLCGLWHYGSHAPAFLHGFDRTRTAGRAGLRRRTTADCRQWVAECAEWDCAAHQSSAAEAYFARTARL